MVTGSPSLFGGLIDVHSWSEVSPDGKYILVMLLPESLRFTIQKDFETYNPGEVYQEEGAELRSMYTECGVYANDGSAKLLWRIPWYVPAYYVYFSTNGKHVLIAQGYSFHSISDIPVRAQLYFHHEDGSHQAWVEHDIGWSWCLRVLFCKFVLDKSFWYDASPEQASGTYVIETNLQETFVFDITTGQISSSSSLWNKGLVTFFIAVPLCVYFMLHRYNSQEDAKRSFTRFSVKKLLVAMTLVGAWFWLITFNWVLAVAVIIAIVLGGGIARIFSGKLRAWMTGTLLAVYGCVWGMFLWAILIEPMIWEAQSEKLYVWLLLVFAVIGLIGGVIIAVILEKRIDRVSDPLLSSAASC
jgi:hypothetical protein